MIDFNSIGKQPHETRSLGFLSEETCKRLDAEVTAFTLGNHGDERYMRVGALRYSKTYLLRDSRAHSQFFGDRMWKAPTLNSVLVEITGVERETLLDRIWRCYYAELPPTKVIPRHVDIGKYFHSVNRYQIYLTDSDEDQIINMAGARTSVKRGEVLSFNHLQPHEYINNSTRTIRFFVFDIYRYPESLGANA